MRAHASCETASWSSELDRTRASRRRAALSKPRIAFVTTELAPVTSGGIGVAVREMARRLAEDGLACTVLTILPRASRAALRRHALPGVEIVDASELAPEELPLRVFRSEAYWRAHRAWRALEVLQSRRSLALAEFPDFEGLGAVAIKAKRLGSSRRLPPLAVRIHGTGELAARADGRNRSTPEAVHQGLLERYALEHADRVVAPSQPILEWMGGHYRLAKERVVEAPPVAPVEAGTMRSAPERGPDPSESELRLLFFGKLQPLKGAAELVQAVGRCLQRRKGVGLRLHVAGPDDLFEGRSQRDAIRKALPAALRDRVVFHGPTTLEQLGRLARECDAAIVPSRLESFGLAAHELAALGLPLLVSDIPAFRAAFADPDAPGLFFEPTVDGIEELLESLSTGGTVLPERTRSVLAWTGESYRRPPARPAPVDRSAKALVSVLVPYHDAHETVDETLASLLASTHDDFEVLIVDDGSRDPAARRHFEELGRRHAGDRRFRFEEKPHGGLSSARNFAVDRARGRYALPLDADDLVHPELLDRAVAALEANSDLGFVSCFSSSFEDGSDPRRQRDWYLPYDPHLPLLLFENGAGTASCLFRTPVLQSFRYDESLEAYEDWDLQIRLAADGVRGEVLPEVLLHVRTRSAGLARSRAWPAHDRLLSRILEARFGDSDDVLREALEIHIAAMAQTRGLGAGFRGEPGRVEAALRWLYHRFLRDRLAEALPAARRQALVEGVRRRLRRGSSSPDDPGG